MAHHALFMVFGKSGRVTDQGILLYFYFIYSLIKYYMSCPGRPISPSTSRVPGKLRYYLKVGYWRRKGHTKFSTDSFEHKNLTLDRGKDQERLHIPFNSAQFYRKYNSSKFKNFEFWLQYKVHKHMVCISGHLYLSDPRTKNDRL